MAIMADEIKETSVSLKFQALKSSNISAHNEYDLATSSSYSFPIIRTQSAKLSYYLPFSLSQNEEKEWNTQKNPIPIATKRTLIAQQRWNILPKEWRKKKPKIMRKENKVRRIRLAERMNSKRNETERDTRIWCMCMVYVFQRIEFLFFHYSYNF